MDPRKCGYDDLVFHTPPLVKILKTWYAAPRNLFWNWLVHNLKGLLTCNVYRSDFAKKTHSEHKNRPHLSFALGGLLFRRKGWPMSINCKMDAAKEFRKYTITSLYKTLNFMGWTIASYRGVLRGFSDTEVWARILFQVYYGDRIYYGMNVWISILWVEAYSFKFYCLR